MKVGRWAATLAALATLLTPWFAAAQSNGVSAPAQSVSYSDWTIDGATVHLRFMLPTAGAGALIGVHHGRVDAAAVTAAVFPSLSVQSSSGGCPAIIQSQWVGATYVLAPIPGLYRFEVIFACPGMSHLVLHDGALFEHAWGHRDYARVQVNGGAPSLQIFSREHQDLTISPAGKPEGWGGPLAFIQQGLRQALGRADALCVIVGLLMVTRRWGDLLPAGLSLGLGYLAALGLAFSGALTIDLGLAGAATGMIVALFGSGVICLRFRSWAPFSKTAKAVTVLALGMTAAAILTLASMKGVSAGLVAAGLLVFGVAQAWLAGVRSSAVAMRFAPAALFGLLDGAAQSGGLSVLKMAGLQLVPAYLGYDLGIMAGLLSVLAAAVGIVQLARPRLQPVQALCGDLAAATLIGVGLFWFISRLYSV